MKKILRNVIAVFAVLLGIAIGSVGQGILACLGGIALAWGGAVTLIEQNTSWITDYKGE